MYNFMSAHTLPGCISYVIYLYIVRTKVTTGGEPSMSISIPQEEDAANTPVLGDSNAGLPLHQREVAVEEETEEQEIREQQDEQYLLVTRALQGDDAAFGEIVDQYSTLMLRTASMIVGDRDIAEDVVQDALIQAWN